MQMQTGVIEGTKKTASNSRVANTSEDVNNSKDALEAARTLTGA